MRPTDRHGAGGGRRAAARVADGGPPQDAAAGRRRAHDPRHRARQPPPRGDGDGGGGHRLRGRADRGAPRRARGAPRGELETVFNPKAEEWNNCYSLWSAREHFARGVLLCNGDTVHPPEVEERLLAGRGHAELVLALDDAKTLGEEEMKVLLERRRAAARDQQGARPGRGGRRVHRADADRAGGGRDAGRGAAGDLGARPAALLRGRLPGVRRPRRARRGRARWAGSSGSRSTTSADLDKAREVAWRC